MTKKQYFVNVLLAYNLSKEFTYKIDEYVEIGSIVSKFLGLELGGKRWLEYLIMD